MVVKCESFDYISLSCLKFLASWLCFRRKRNTSVVSKLRATNQKNVDSSQKSTWNAAWKSEFFGFCAKQIVML